MKIECISKEGFRKLLTIVIDGDAWRDIDPTIFGRKPQLPKGCTSLEEWEERFTEAEYKAAFAYAIKALSLKSRSSPELQKNLTDRLVAESTAERIVAECISRGYINDTAWVESFVRCQAARHVGPQAIACKLYAKGIPTQLAEAAIDKICRGSSLKHIEHLLKTRYASRDLSQFKEKQKVIAALMRKGFSFAEISTALKGT